MACVVIARNGLGSTPLFAMTHAHVVSKNSGKQHTHKHSICQYLRLADQNVDI